MAIDADLSSGFNNKKKSHVLEDIKYKKRQTSMVLWMVLQNCKGDAIMSNIITATNFIAGYNYRYGAVYNDI